MPQHRNRERERARERWRGGGNLSQLLPSFPTPAHVLHTNTARKKPLDRPGELDILDHTASQASVNIIHLSSCTTPSLSTSLSHSLCTLFSCLDVNAQCRNTVQHCAPCPIAEVHKNGGPHPFTTNALFAKFAVLYSALPVTLYFLYGYYHSTHDPNSSSETAAIKKYEEVDCADLLVHFNLWVLKL